MRTPVVIGVSSLLCLVVAAAAPAAEKTKEKTKKKASLKAGWTEANVKSASDDCTEALVQGMWENTKKDQGVDASKPLTDEIRKQLEPQIAPMRKLCTCAVREGAKRY